MREIKFRAWKNEDRYMITSKQGVYTALQNCMNITKKDNGYYTNADLLKPDQKKYILMQYTGLKDKNGKEIYEGDKITYTQEVIEYEGSSKPYSYLDLFEGIVIYDSGCFWVNDRPLYELLKYEEVENVEQLKNIEIIGNIYENLELLESNQVTIK